MTGVSRGGTGGRHQRADVDGRTTAIPRPMAMRPPMRLRGAAPSGTPRVRTQAAQDHRGRAHGPRRMTGSRATRVPSDRQTEDDGDADQEPGRQGQAAQHVVGVSRCGAHHRRVTSPVLHLLDGVEMGEMSSSLSWSACSRGLPARSLVHALRHRVEASKRKKVARPGVRLAGARDGPDSRHGQVGRQRPPRSPDGLGFRTDEVPDELTPPGGVVRERHEVTAPMTAPRRRVHSGKA